MKHHLIAATLAASLAACAGAPEPAKPAATAKPACTPPPTQLVVKDLKPGEGDTVRNRSVVHAAYTGWLYDPCAKDNKGTMFDTSEGRPTPFGFIVGAGRVIRGWDEGVLGMKPGGKRLLVIPPDKAYGAKGAGEGAIPPNATLVFEVEIARITQQLDPAPKAP